VLRELDLQPVYDSSEYDLVKDLMVPLLQHSKMYVRGVGFFSSGWLRVAADGIVGLIENGGRARYVISPILEEKDWEAFKAGNAAQRDDALKSILRRNIRELREGLEKDTRNCLAWLVADDLLEFRFAVSRETGFQGHYHDKVGVFTDQAGDRVAIHGSFNDSFQGSLNGEAFSVFKSWEPVQDAFVQHHGRRLDRLWENENRQFCVYSIPDAIREELIELRSSRGRPYRLPGTSVLKTMGNGLLCCPYELRKFQEEAITSWEKAECRGLLEMATGTGKTVTALAAAVSRFQELKQLALVILVPYLHLVQQWQRDCQAFGFLPVPCSSAHSGWQMEAASKIQDFRIGGIRHLCIIAVHKTAASVSFLAKLEQLPQETSMLVADEAHALGARNLRKALSHHIGLRLGLSATPKRWFDQEGTFELYSYFSGVCYEYPLESAIRDGFLVPYEYHPILVGLSQEELERYAELTNTIGALRSQADQQPEVASRLEKVLLERARIVSNASQKLPGVLKLVQRLVRANEGQRKELRHLLVYCAPSTHKNVLRALSGVGLRCHEFVHTVTLPQREELLERFAKSDIQALVAIKCLDEGLDVPPTRTAIFMSSTTNPREFIQRRGRILRPSPGKEKAIIYDFLVVPPVGHAGFARSSEESLLRREMPRFAEFSSVALNRYEARSVVRDILDKYEMLFLLDEKPWDVYHKLRRAEEMDEPGI
jgi:superfamily II DNA or RNA helicase